MRGEILVPASNTCVQRGAVKRSFRSVHHQEPHISDDLAHGPRVHTVGSMLSNVCVDVCAYQLARSIKAVYDLWRSFDGRLWC